MADPIETSEGGVITVAAGPHGVYLSLDLSAHDQVAPVGLTLSDSEVHDLCSELSKAALEYASDPAHHEKLFAKGNNTQTDHPGASKHHKEDGPHLLFGMNAFGTGLTLIDPKATPEESPKEPPKKRSEDDKSNEAAKPATSTVTLGDAQGKTKAKPAPKEATGQPGKSAGEIEAKQEAKKPETVTE